MRASYKSQPNFKFPTFVITMEEVKHSKYKMKTRVLVKCFFFVGVFAKAATASRNDGMERVSGFDLLDLRGNCNSSTPIWTFSTMNHQSPIFSIETESLCYQRLRRNSFFWAQIDIEKVRGASTKDLFVYIRRIQDFPFGSNSGKDVDMVYDKGQYQFLIEMSQEDSMDNIKVLLKKKMNVKKNLGQSRKSPKLIAHQRQICVNFGGIRRINLQRNLEENYDLCFRNKAMYQGYEGAWTADVEIPVKSDTVETTIVVPSFIHF
ncbi:uncharacterized protein LOC129801133 [Phlebotomus papatasi]|uniref:uncharacterized protein LOC129801133 n=1 Tax=Phlebotomus papatasi TaxID=29031 RepID=UPI002483F7EE|nr:uncharacterized protein LOC129801133 [Phlebotomus papatasi]